MICLKANLEDEAFILPYMKPEVEKGDIVNLVPCRFYMMVTVDESEDAFSGQTVPLDVEESDKIAKAVIANSQKQYATPKTTVEKQMERLFQETESSKTPPSKVMTTRRQAIQAKLHDV